MENLFNYQAKVIKELADEEACIIIGRCADYVLRDYDNVLSVFVHAPEAYCIEQAKAKLSMPDKEIRKYIQKTDKERAEYYKHYTGREWTDARNYDLCLDSSKLGMQKCIEEIKAYMEVRFRYEWRERASYPLFRMRGDEGLFFMECFVAVQKTIYKVL